MQYDDHIKIAKIWYYYSHDPDLRDWYIMIYRMQCNPYWGT